jgi:outer membrane protein TolC
MMFGAGSGIGTSSVLSLNDAYFAPLVARQRLCARQADVQAATNDSMVSITDAYFSVQQARGGLAAAADVTRRTAEILRRVKSLALGLVAPLEVIRTESELARRQDAEVAARESWQVTGTDLARILRLDASAQIEPVEPPHLVITLIDPEQPIDDLISTGLRNRPELAANQAQVEATLTLLRQEKLRPFVPSVLLRGFSTPVAGTLAGGIFAGGRNDDIGSAGGRLDLDFQVLWQLDNLGFGNVARTRARESDHRAAILELFRAQDRVAADVSRAFAQSRQAARRVTIAKRQVTLALDSYDKNLIGLGQTRQAGDLIQTIVRPQEAIASLQTLIQAYDDYYRAVADSNRAQFRLYRAVGQPAQLLEQRLDDQSARPAVQNPALPPAPSDQEPRASFQIQDR